jgi:hypothetical protein
MKIGDKDYRTSRPDNLDAQLVSTLGLSAAEVAQQLAGAPMPHVVAAALRPCLPKDAPSIPEIASAISGDGYDDALTEARKLYAAPAPAAAAPSSK